jgi:hypothetical protein
MRTTMDIHGYNVPALAREAADGMGTSVLMRAALARGCSAGDWSGALDPLSQKHPAHRSLN